MKRISKLVAFNLAFALIAIVSYSKWGLALSFNVREGAFRFSLACTLAIVGLFVFACVNYRVLTQKDELTFEMSELTTVNKCISALKECQQTDPAFASEIKIAIEQLFTLERRTETLETLLRQNEAETSYEYLSEIAKKAEFYVFAGIKRLINMFIVFDNDEYNRNPKRFDIKGYRMEISKIINENELILSEYAKMLSALSKNLSALFSEEGFANSNLQEIKDMTQALTDVLAGEEFAGLEQQYNQTMEG